MANQNPIRTNNDGDYIEFSVSNANASKTLKISSAIKLSDENEWKYTELNEVSVGGNPYNPTPSEPLDKLSIEKFSDLAQKKMSIRSIIAQVPSGTEMPEGEVTVPSVKYSLTFYADDIKLDEFSLSTPEQPATYYTKIKIKLQP